LSLTMVMGKSAKLAEMAKLPEMAEDSRDQTAAAERMEMDAMEKRQLGDSSMTCDPSWTSRTGKTCKDYEVNNWCTKDGNYGTGWEETFKDFDYWALNGRSALVCPQCGCKGAMRQYFIVNKRVDCEEAENLCKSQGAQLMSVKSFKGLKSKERELLKKYLESQSQYDSTGTMDMWVGGSLAGSSSNGSSSNRMCKRLYMADIWVDIYGPFQASTQINRWRRMFPLCKKRPTAAPPMTTTTPTMAPPKVPGALKSGACPCKSFFVIDKEVNSTEAQKMCKSKGAQLVRWNTEAERKLLIQFLEQPSMMSALSRNDVYRVWVGRGWNKNDPKPHNMVIEPAYSLSGEPYPGPDAWSHYPVCEIIPNVYSTCIFQ